MAGAADAPLFRGLICGTKALLLFDTIVTETMLRDGDTPTQVGSFTQSVAISTIPHVSRLCRVRPPSSMFKS